MRKISFALLAAAVAVLGDAGIAAAAEPPTAEQVVTRINEATAAFLGDDAVEPAAAAAPTPTPTTSPAALTQQAEQPGASEHAVAAQQPTSMGQAIVGFAPGRMPAVARGSRFNGLDVVNVSYKGSFFTVNAPDLDVVHRALANVPGVAYVEDNGVLRATVTPNDPRYGDQYGPNMMGFPTAWGSVGYGSTAVTVGIVDSGILKTHQDLTGGRVLQGFDYYNNDSDPNDNCGHGTHVAGTVGATTNNSLGVAGMAQARLLMMKALQSSFLSGCSGPYDAIAQAIMDAADQGARIISMSIGGGASATLQNAINYADNKGVILVAAAGNDGGANSVDYPAAYPNVIAVGALTSSKARASYSDGGPQLDIAAPGSNVLSTYTGSSNATYSSLSGTSMATPHVAGALALAMSCAPGGTTKTTLVNALYSTAEDLGAAGRDDAYGYGLARADRLVAQICGGTPPPPPANRAPTANFTTSGSGMAVSVDGSSSTDPDGDTLTYSWNWGDGTAAGSGVTASHTYGTAGTYNITLTVNDGRGGTNSKTLSFTATSSPPPPTDPDPSTPTINSGQTVSVRVSSSTPERFYKILIPSGRTQIRAATTGPSCSWWSCSVDADLYTRQGVRPTDSTYACRSQARGNSETCTTSTASGVWWYVRIKRYSGSGTVNLTVTLS